MYRGRSTHVRGRAALLLAAVALLAAGCNFGAHRTVVITTGPTGTTTIIHTPTATPTIIKGYPRYAAGQTGTISVPSQNASLTITAGVPSVSTTRLSPSYGYAPEYGYYVTFPLVIRNTGQASLLIERLDFYVKTPKLGKVTTNGGDAPYSGSPQQLDSTLLAPGKTIRKPLTFDVSVPKGTFYYAPGGKPTIAWTFSPSKPS